MRLLFLVQMRAAAPPRCTKFHKRPLKWNRFKWSHQDRFIAKLAQRVMISCVRTQTGKCRGLSVDIYIQLCALPWQSKCQSSKASKSRQELLECTNLEPLWQKNGTKIGEVLFHMQSTYSGGDLQGRAALCSAGCNASPKFSRVATNCAMKVWHRELRHTINTFGIRFIFGVKTSLCIVWKRANGGKKTVDKLQNTAQAGKCAAIMFIIIMFVG